MSTSNNTKGPVGREQPPSIEYASLQSTVPIYSTTESLGRKPTWKHKKQHTNKGKGANKSNLYSNQAAG